VDVTVQGSIPELSYASVFFSLLGLAALSVVAANVVGWEIFRARVQKLPLVRSAILSLTASNVVKALLLIGGFIPVAIFLALSYIKQRIRVAVWLRAGTRRTRTAVATSPCAARTPCPPTPRRCGTTCAPGSGCLCC